MAVCDVIEARRAVSSARTNAPTPASLPSNFLAASSALRGSASSNAVATFLTFSLATSSSAKRLSEATEFSRLNTRDDAPACCSLRAASDTSAINILAKSSCVILYFSSVSFKKSNPESACFSSIPRMIRATPSVTRSPSSNPPSCFDKMSVAAAKMRFVLFSSSDMVKSGVKSFSSATSLIAPLPLATSSGSSGLSAPATVLASTLFFANVSVASSNAASSALATASVACATMSSVPASIAFSALPLASTPSTPTGAPLRPNASAVSVGLYSLRKSASISVFCAAIFCNVPAVPSTKTAVLIGLAAAFDASVVTGVLSA